MEFVYPILIFVVMGIVFGVLLVVISKVFAVETDERAVKITEALPGANCGACGFAGCSAYASAVVHDGVPTNKCVPGGEEVAEKISSIMGTSSAAGKRMRAEVLCVGCEGVAKDKYEYRGMMNCSSVTRLGKGAKECPVPAISPRSRMAVSI